MELPGRFAHMNNCYIHFLKRTDLRGINLNPADIEQLEEKIKLARIAFEKPGQTRYWIKVKYRGQRFKVMYDTDLCCLVTVCALKPRYLGDKYGC